jgi:hypothetical protein
MGLMAVITGSLGALVAVIGIVEALNLIGQPLIAGLDWTFWLSVSAIVMLGTIALAVGGRGGDYD